MAKPKSAKTRISRNQAPFCKLFELGPTRFPPLAGPLKSGTFCVFFECMYKMDHLFSPTTKFIKKRGWDKIRKKHFCVCSGPPIFFGSGPANGGKRVVPRLQDVNDQIKNIPSRKCFKEH